jgi:hypothetical protein
MRVLTVTWFYYVSRSGSTLSIGRYQHAFTTTSPWNDGDFRAAEK